MSEENLRYTIEHGIYGIPSKRAEKLVQLVRVGDRIVVYVMKEDCKDLCESFAAVLEVVSDWRRSSKPTWPDEVKDNEVKYPWVVDVRVLASGKVLIDEVYSELSKILPLEESQGKLSGSKLRIFGMNFSKKPVSNELCELIMRRLRAGSKVAFDHETVKDWLVEIGEVLGYYVKTEFESGGYRFDVAWFLWDNEPPIAVFEVVVGGDVDKAVQRLVYARRRLRVKGLFLVVADRDEEERAGKVLKETYPELKVEIWYPDKVKELRDTLSKHEDEVRKLTILRRQV
jgi:predicted RNA-binding protein